MNGDTRDLMPEYQPSARGGQGGARHQPPPPVACSLAEEARRAVAAVASLNHVLPTPPPPANGRTPLLSSVVGPGRYEAFFPVLRRWFDLDDAGLSAVLGRIEAGRSWVDAPFPGVRYFHFQAGPGAAAQESGCLLLSPGALFPHHLHHGTERSLILEGSLLLDGKPRHAGQVIEALAGSTHDFVAGPHQNLVLIVGHDGVSFSV